MSRIVGGEGGIVEAVRLLRSGEVVALPTETVYGLAADAFSPRAVVKIFEAKGRPLSDPLIVHLLDASWLDRVAVVKPEHRELIDALAYAFWPGPLTLVLPRQPTVPDLVTAGLETVAVRVTAHPLMRAVLTSLDRPLAAPSANRFGRISPTCAEDVMKELGARIPLILDGGQCRHGVESTIIWPHEGMLHILRSGPITSEELSSFGSIVEQSMEGKAPGSRPSHYAPRLPFSWYDSTKPPDASAAFLAFRQAPPGFYQVEILSPTGDLCEAASRLYGALRRLDESGAKSLLVEPVPEEGIGVAIMDRLRRATAARH